MIECRWPFACRPGARLSNHRIEIEGVSQKECTVVVPIVADEPIAYGRLRRSGFQCRVRIDDTHRNIKTRIRDAPHADTAIMVWNVLEQPLDRVVSVTAFVNLGRALLSRDIGTCIDELSFRHYPPAHVLINEDITFLGHLHRRSDGGLEVIGTVWPHTISRAIEHDRIFP